MGFAVLRVLQVAQPGRQPVDAAVQAPDLGVEGVDEAPQQVFALVGELEAVGADTIGEDAERLAYSRDSFVIAERSRSDRADGLPAIESLSELETATLGAIKLH